MVEGGQAMTETYNGWKNYETWNVALWLNNDEGLYSLCKDLHDDWGDSLEYSIIRDYMLSISPKTPDGVCWGDHRLDYDALTECVREMWS